jgi:hypothetical protein
MQKNKEAFYRDLKKKLKKQHKFPSVYMFKFIVPNDNKLHAQVEALFGSEAQIAIRESRNGNFVSVTAKEMMLSADKVIERYREAESIEGIISL